jgi:hypothetical protein
MALCRKILRKIKYTQTELRCKSIGGVISDKGTYWFHSPHPTV